MSRWDNMATKNAPAPGALARVGLPSEAFLTKAIAQHGMWKYRLYQAIEVGGSSIDVATVAVDNRCSLGQWLYGGESRHLRGSARYEQVRELHAKFHRAAADVLRLSLIGRRAEASQALASGSPFLQTSSSLVQLLDGWRTDPSGVVRDASGGAQDELVGTAIETAAQADVAAQAVNVVRSNVETLAAAIEEMTAAMGEIAANATSVSNAVTSAVGTGEAVSFNMSRLTESVGKIEDVLSLITGIAKQTNLLALNATIEATRAGEAGRGFGVVAGEVKELAKQTAEAAQDVAKKVASIEESAAIAAGEMKRLTSVIRQLHDTQLAITAAVEQQSAATNEISRSVSETAAAGSEIAENVAAVALAARNTVGSARQHS